MENKKLGLCGPKGISQWSEKSFWSSRKEKKMKESLHETADLLAIEKTLERLREIIPDSRVLDNYITATRKMKAEKMRKFDKNSRGIKFQDGVYP